MTKVYATTSQRSTEWSEPFETVYQSQSRERGRRCGRGHRADITQPLRLLVGSAVALGESRPHGMITWLAEVLATSRQTIYAIGEAWGTPSAAHEKPVAATAGSPGEQRNQIARAALTLLVVGAMRLRGVELCLEHLLGQGRSVGWLSALVDEAGQRAGAVLAAADWSAAPEMIVARDELFMGEQAWLLTVDTRSHAIVSGHVENHVDAATWGVSLALDVLATGEKIVGLAEDGGSWYPASVGQAQGLLDAPFRPGVQKDVWHVLDKAAGVLRDAERIALRHLAIAESKASRIGPGRMRIHDFDGWEAAHQRAARRIQVADAIRAAVHLLPEVLDLVDRRTAAILDRDTAAWYIEAIVHHLRALDSDLATSLAITLENQAGTLLTFHDRLAAQRDTWRAAALEHFADPDVVVLFERAVARACRLSRAVTNGRAALRHAATDAAGYVRALCHNDPIASHLATTLTAALDGAVRTSSTAENVNSILRAYIWGRRAFRDRRTAQNWLNLIVLWYNLHVFQRGKRVGHCPFDLAGVTVRGPDGRPTKDWLTALGYAQAA